MNTYAGSILIAAQRRNDEIVASLEDAGYGIPIQKANFPHLNFYEHESYWPLISLKNTVVCCHPPCAAFSSQNRGSMAHRGVNAPKVRCTAKVLDYAMSNGAEAVVVESVPKALEGLREFHNEFAERYGYDVYRTMINAGSLGVPQYRPRFWCFFLRKGLAREMSFAMEPKRKTVAEVVANSKSKVLTELPWVTEHTQEQIERIKQAGAGPEYFKTARGSVVKTLAEHLKLAKHDGEADIYECPCQACSETRRSAMGWNFTSHSMVMLAPNDLAPTLLAGSWWFYQHRALVAEEYKEIMDFPRAYRFPGEYFLKRTREYLSRGVCPSTAQWALGQVEAALDKRDPIGSLRLSIKPGETATFRLPAGARRVDLETIASAS